VAVAKERDVRIYRAMLVAVLVVPIAHCSCSRPPSQPEPATDPAPATPPGQVADEAATSTSASNASSDGGRAAGREAISTLHAYLALLPGGDYPRADAFWARADPGRPPGDAALRSHRNLKAVRIDTGMPQPIDREHPPRALEIPVRVRLSGQDGNGVLQGHYRVRLRIDGQGWEITSAELHPQLD